MDLGDHRGAFPDSGRNSLGRSSAYVANREDAGLAGFQRLRALAGHDEPFIIGLDTAGQPLGIGVGADEQKEVPQRAAI
jgi:hypothetical protein